MGDGISSALVWFRRDLRHVDHAALYHALKSARKVWCVFVFDTDILEPLPRCDRRVAFIRDSLVELDAALAHLAEQGTADAHALASGATAGLIVRHGRAVIEIPKLAQALGVQAVFTNHDDEPTAIARDAQVRGRLSDVGAALYTSKDHVIFERNEVLTGNGTPYGVFTPYKNAWLKKIDPFYLKPYPIAERAHKLAPIPPGICPIGQPRVPTLGDIGFEDPGELRIAPGMSGARALLDDFIDRIDHYHEARDFPGIKGPSYLAPHLRFGTVSIRELAGLAWTRAQAQPPSPGAQTWLSELIWRDFYHQILFHHPHVVGGAYKREYDKIKWVKGKAADALFAAWCDGRTGYPLVDAAMRQLNQTGYMHNRLRMVTASFLVKDLGIDWRRGEAYFAEKLLDFDLAANNGGWQWAASTGCDAQPYFRIFNPINQSEKFDPQGKFIRRYVPEIAALPERAIHAPWLARPHDLAEASDVVIGRDYPQPIVMHDEAREATLARYAVVKGG